MGSAKHSRVQVAHGGGQRTSVGAEDDRQRAASASIFIYTAVARRLSKLARPASMGHGRWRAVNGGKQRMLWLLGRAKQGSGCRCLPPAASGEALGRGTRLAPTTSKSPGGSRVRLRGNNKTSKRTNLSRALVLLSSLDSPTSRGQQLWGKYCGINARAAGEARRAAGMCREAGAGAVRQVLHKVRARAAGGVCIVADAPDSGRRSCAMQTAGWQCATCNRQRPAAREQARSERREASGGQRGQAASGPERLGPPRCNCSTGLVYTQKRWCSRRRSAGGARAGWRDMRGVTVVLMARKALT
ncbi:hypothetical protein GGX14DRAFT_588005 [Mycena pura]|uniref:Uncharacterized protein n=1 Tax=Mycena pura TaxID=153505 RepID=A0AAD6USA5_9AGAR|nr:hypothetical protein GGX14DRAFT_588005 [Mycena pura]